MEIHSLQSISYMMTFARLGEAYPCLNSSCMCGRALVQLPFFCGLVRGLKIPSEPKSGDLIASVGYTPTINSTQIEMCFGKSLESSQRTAYIAKPIIAGI